MWNLKDYLQTINEGHKEDLRMLDYPILKMCSKGDFVKELQKLLFIKADGIFGILTYLAVRSFQSNNGLKIDGIVGQKTWEALLGHTIYLTPSRGLYLIKTKPQKIKIVILGDTLHNAKVNGVNGTFFDTPNPKLASSCWGLAVDEGRPLGSNSHLTDWKGRKRGTIAWNGKELICKRINKYTEIPDMIWGVSGIMLLPSYDRYAEEYFSDVYRKTNHTVIGFDANNNVYLLVKTNVDMKKLVKICNELRLVGAVSLDGGGSSQLNFNGRGYKSNRKINSAVLVTG